MPGQKHTARTATNNPEGWRARKPHRTVSKPFFEAPTPGSSTYPTLCCATNAPRSTEADAQGPGRTWACACQLLQMNSRGIPKLLSVHERVRGLGGG